MLVRDENGIERMDVFSDCSQTARDFTPAQTGIDQDAGSIRGDKG